MARAAAKVGIFGASGFAGAELMRLCAGHKGLDVVLVGAGAHAGEPVASLYPNLAQSYAGRRFSGLDVSEADGLDLLFTAMPHGAAAAMMEEALGRVGKVVDLSADFRLGDAEAYRRWYGLDHPCPHLLKSFSYGLPELFREQIVPSAAVAAPGCYVTAAALGLAPLVRARVISDRGVVVDAASGISGAGRGLDQRTQFAAAEEEFVAYGLCSHRHTPEIEQATGAEVIFTPHLAPMTRGILATCYARPARDTSTSELLAILEDAFREEPFVLVSEEAPSTKATRGSNSAHITARWDARTGWAVVLCAIDNLMKGASGQAVQCANLALGFAETEGLAVAGLYP